MAFEPPGLIVITGVPSSSSHNSTQQHTHNVHIRTRHTHTWTSFTPAFNTTGPEDRVQVEQELLAMSQLSHATIVQVWWKRRIEQGLRVIRSRTSGQSFSIDHTQHETRICLSSFLHRSFVLFYFKSPPSWPSILIVLLVLWVRRNHACDLCQKVGKDQVEDPVENERKRTRRRGGGGGGRGFSRRTRWRFER